MFKKIAFSMLFFFLLTSCNKKSPTEAEHTNPLVGTWNLTTMKINGATVNHDDYSDIAVKIIFLSDGTGTVWMEDKGHLESGGSISLIWNTTGNQMTVQLQGEDAATATYSINNNSLTLTFTDGGSFIYTKQS